MKTTLRILIIVLLILGISVGIWVSIEINNYVIPNTGLMVKEVLKDARQTVKPQIWITIISLISAYVLTLISAYVLTYVNVKK